MRIAKVIGTVTLSVQHPSMTGSCYRIVVPQSLANLQNADAPIAEELIALDEFGAGQGSYVD